MLINGECSLHFFDSFVGTFNLQYLLYNIQKRLEIEGIGSKFGLWVPVTNTGKLAVKVRQKLCFTFFLTFVYLYMMELISPN